MNAQDMVRLKQLAADICVRENCRLYDIEIVGQGKGRILRVFIEKTPSEQVAQQVTLADCSNVSNGLSLQLDVEDLIPGGSYQLEVSSPGLDRKLVEPWHYQTVIGQSVKVWLHRALGSIAEGDASIPAQWGKTQTLSGIVESADEKELKIKVEESVLVIPFVEVEKAKAVVEFGGAAKPTGKNKKAKELKKKR